MTKRLASAAIAVVVLLNASCGDNQRSSPTEPGSARSEKPSLNAGPVPGTCVNPNTFASDVNAVEPLGSKRTTMLGYVGQLQTAVSKRDYATARIVAFGTVALLLDQFKAHALTGTPAQAAKLMNDFFCYSGLGITITDPANAFVLFPTDPARIIKNSDGTGGSSLPAAAVAEPTVIQFALIPDTFGGVGGPLHTRLDQYPTFIDVSSQSETGAPLAKPVVAAICPKPGLNPNLRARLLVGHNATAGFELTPKADGSFLSCTESIAAAPSKLPRWLQAVASLFTPREAHAGMQDSRSPGIGGTTDDFGQFGGVDPLLRFSGGVGGTAGEFTVKPVLPTPTLPDGPNGPPPTSPLTPSGPSFTVVDGVCTATAAAIGGTLEPLCSPATSFRTFRGTKVVGVTVKWTIENGGGTLAPAVKLPWSCGDFGATTTTTSDTDGETHICWTMGPTVGTDNNTLVAKPGPGGDASVGVFFVPSTGRFTASGLAMTPTATATDLSVVFDNTPHPGSGTCSNGLTPVLSYRLGTAPLPSAPTDAGTYTLIVSCGDGGVKFTTVTATASIVITPAATTTTVTCPVSVPATGSPQTPCTVAVTGPGLSLTPAATYTANTAPGTATASYTYAAAGNYLGSTGSATFKIIGTPTATAADASFTFDNTAHPGSGTCSDGLVPVFSYRLGATPLAGAPTDAGAYALIVTCGDDGVKFTTVTATAALVITPAATTTTVTCPASVPATGAPQTPCTVAVTGPGLSLTPAATYTANTAPGTATASYTFAAGGNYLGSTGSKTFLIVAGTPTAAASDASFTFDNAPHAGSGTCSDGLIPVLSYRLGGAPLPGAPTNVGAYTLIVTCSDGGVKFTTATATATLTISPAATSTTVTCPTSVPATGSPQTPCTVAVTGPGLSLTPTPTYTSNTAPGTATASYTFAAGGNYLGSTGSATFQILAGTPTAGASDASFTFDNTPHPGSGTCSDGLIPVLSYKLGATALPGAPTNVGAYTLIVTCGDGGVKFTTATATAALTISPAATSTTVTCPTSVPATGSPQTPCTVAVTGPGLSLTPTPTYSANTAPGTATASYTYAPGGNYLGSSGSATFQILAGTPTAGASDASFTFDNTPHPGSGTCSDGLIPVLSYKLGATALPGAPSNVGAYTLIVTCGDGGVKFTTATATAALTISPAATSTTVTCPTSVPATGSPQTPCTVSVTGPGLSSTPTPTYSANTAPGTATASYTYAAGGNYLGSSGSATFQILAGTPTAGASDASFTFDNFPHAGSGTCSDGLIPVLSYKLGATALPGAPSNVGAYTLIVTCGDGGVKFTTATATAALTISPAATSTTVTCPTSVPATGSPQTPCTVSVTGPGLSLTPTPTYSANTAPGTATASYTFAAGGNYLGSSGSATFQILAGTPIAGASDASFTFDNSPHASSGTCSDGLIPVLSYRLGSSPLPGAPTNVGAYTLIVTCGDGGVKFTTATATAALTISPAATSTTVTCPTSVPATGSPQTPCTVSVTGPGLSSTPTPTYSANTAPGTATASYTFAAGGNYLGSSGSATFQILAGTPIAGASDASFTFDNTPHPGSGTCSDGLIPVLSYRLGSSPLPGAPTNVGAYTLIVTCGDGGVKFTTATATAALAITPAATSTTVTCPTSVPATGSPQTPCTVAVTGPGLSLTPTPTYTANTDPGTATASYTFAGGGNYLGSSGSATFQIVAGLPTAGASDASFTFDNTPHAGSGTCSDGLIPVLSYRLGATPLPGAPTNVGAYTLIVTCGDGGVKFTTATATAALTITPAATSTTVTCPTSVPATGSPQTPCSVAVTGPALSLTPAPSYTANTAPGTATASYTFAGGGNYLGSSGSATFQIRAGIPTATANNVSVTFDNAPHAGSGTCSDGLIPILSYALGGSPLAGVPTNAGTYALIVTCGDGGVKFTTVTATAAIVVAPAATTTTVSCPASVTYTGLPQTPCTVSVTGPALSLSPAATYAANTDAGTATASYTFAAGGNYLGSTASKTFLIVFSFKESFEVESGWTATGLWHRSTLRSGGAPIVNVLSPNYVNADQFRGALPAPFVGSWAAWYGTEPGGNFVGTQVAGDPLHSGGTSVSANSGTFTSPIISLPPAAGSSLILRFNTWFDIEGLRPSTHDIMQISVFDVDAGTTTPLGMLNPSADPTVLRTAANPFTTRGLNQVGAWIETVRDLSPFRGRTIRLVYSFDTKDEVANGFRGWVIDNVRIATEVPK